MYIRAEYEYKSEIIFWKIVVVLKRTFCVNAD